MASRSKPKRKRAASSSKYPGERELVVIAKAEVGLRASAAALEATSSDADVSSLSAVLNRHSATMLPLFGVSEDRLRAEVSTLAAVADVPDLSTYYRVSAPEEKLDDIAAELREHAVVAAAYVKPRAEPPEINDMTPAPADAPPVSADFSARQLYLNAAPTGVDARFAWTLAGGRGANVRIVDVEGAWRFTHEDLTQNQGGVVGGTPSADIHWRNHGTAVVGVFGGDNNGFGVTGICPDANVSAISIFGNNMGSAAAIRMAANRLQAGDILLIELHRPGPRNNFADRDDQNGYIAVEWWPDDFDAIAFATARGVIVVEAGGNGAQNLDDAIYNTPGPGFPAGWTNPFNRTNRDSGAIVVGAGAPPPGTHGRDNGPDRSRLDFSNFGSLVDVQGWGREVTTCGYGDLQGGTNEDIWYTDQFSGTSSSSPVIVGTLGCLQGILRARRATLLTPARARQLLRTTGSPQQAAPGRPVSQRIGNRPDLRALVTAATGKIVLKEVKEVFKDSKDVKDRVKDTKEVAKDAKDAIKERKDVKEIEKRVKEFKDVKEIEKLPKEKDKEKDLVEHGGGIDRQINQPGAQDDMSTRLARLEQTVAQLAHFIGPDLRPDLSAGALSYENDLSAGDAGALSAELDQQAASAKSAKDAKDMEKLRDR